MPGSKSVSELETVCGMHNLDMDDGTMLFFTICSKNFLSQALTLYESLVRSYGMVQFYLALCDTPVGYDTLSLPFPVIEIPSLGIPGWDQMQSTYNITELNTSLKPFVFQYLMDRFPGGCVAYLDPDILVVSRLVEVDRAMASGANCILTPHVTEPVEFAEFDDQKFLQYGVFNLGFCVFRDIPSVRRVLSWWGRRLEKQCVIDLANGLFVDQKWADLFPAYLDGAVVLRHCGYNVGYWNLSHRRVWRKGERWMVNDQELRFAHFSGGAFRSRTVFSRHSKAFTRQNIGELSVLLEHYESRLQANGHDYFVKLPYGFNWNGAGGKNLHTPEHALEGRRDNSSEGMSWLPLQRYSSMDDYLRGWQGSTGVEEARRELESALLPSEEEPFTIDGFCALCGRRVDFQIGFMYAARGPKGTLVPNWREHLDCKRCGLVNRIRASLQVFLQEFHPGSDSTIYITERITRTYEWLESRFENVEGSEFYGEGYEPGEHVGGIRNEDLQALSFRGDQFDYILSFDVLEHVPFEERAFSEMFRCLKPGGKLLFTAPFSVDHANNVVRAEMDDTGAIRHLMEPEYHGNPVDMEGGALAFRYFGWQCLNQLREVGFRNPTALHYWSRGLGYLGANQFIMTAEKPQD